MWWVPISANCSTLLLGFLNRVTQWHASIYLAKQQGLPVGSFPHAVSGVCQHLLDHWLHPEWTTPCHQATNREVMFPPWVCLWPSPHFLSAPTSPEISWHACLFKSSLYLQSTCVMPANIVVMLTLLDELGRHIFSLPDNSCRVLAEQRCHCLDSWMHVYANWLSCGGNI